LKVILFAGYHMLWPVDSWWH